MINKLGMLYKQINTYKNIIKNKNLFIKHKNIIKVKIQTKNRNKKKIEIENYLPYQVFFGSSYLIKNNNIIEIYSYADFNYSIYIQINKKKSTWVSKLNIINVEKNDPYNIKKIINDYSILFTPSELEFLICEFINDGFELYVK